MRKLSLREVVLVTRGHTADSCGGEILTRICVTPWNSLVSPKDGAFAPHSSPPWMTPHCPRSDGGWDLSLNQEVESFRSREAPPACSPGDRPEPGAPSPESRPLRLCPLSGAEAHPGLESSLRVPPADMVLVLPCRVFFLNVPLDSVIERLTLRRTDPVTGERSVPAPQWAAL